MKPLRPLAALCLAALANALPAADTALLAKARAYIATEATLAGLKSIQYQGTLVTADPADPTKEIKIALDIAFQHPYQQRIIATTDRSIETTALDGYDGWGRVQDPKDPARSRLTILPPDRIRRLRATTWENLAYYSGIERVGGRIEDNGTATIDGIACRKLSFFHAPNIVFHRHFDPANGRLVFTETESGETIREEGELIVQGIRFPRTLITTTKGPKGESRVARLTFERIVINEPIPASHFAVPAYKAR